MTDEDDSSTHAIENLLLVSLGVSTGGLLGWSVLGFRWTIPGAVAGVASMYLLRYTRVLLTLLLKRITG